MTLLGIILVAVIALIIYLYYYLKKHRATSYTPYLEALIALLDKDENLAIKKFIEAVNSDSDLIDAYIRLGDLYRKRGDLSKAIQIHQSLTVRAILKKKVEKEVYYALVRDFLEIKRPIKAISYLKEILKIDKKDKTAMAMTIRILEDMEQYADCINVYEDRGFTPKEENRLAFYYASSAYNKLKNMNKTDNEEEEEKDALNFFKKALKISENSLTTLYYLAHHFTQKGDLKKAKEFYSKIMSNHPDHLFLIIPGIEKVYFELGSFDNIISIYEKIFSKKPDNFSVGFALANLYEKKNDIESAKDVYRRLADRYAKNILPRLHLLKLMTGDRAVKNELTEIEKVIKHNRVRCKNCGYETDGFPFICTQCHAVESFLPYL